MALSSFRGSEEVKLPSRRANLLIKVRHGRGDGIVAVGENGGKPIAVLHFGSVLLR